jgi:hypothetical protein
MNKLKCFAKCLLKSFLFIVGGLLCVTLFMAIPFTLLAYGEHFGLTANQRLLGSFISAAVEAIILMAFLICECEEEK